MSVLLALVLSVAVRRAGPRQLRLPLRQRHGIPETLRGHAYRSVFELTWWHSKTLPDTRRVAGLLRRCGVCETDVAMAQAVLVGAAEAVEHGAILNPASVGAIGWLNAQTVYFRAPGLHASLLKSRCQCARCSAVGGTHAPTAKDPRDLG